MHKRRMRISIALGLLIVAGVGYATWSDWSQDPDVPPMGLMQGVQLDKEQFMLARAEQVARLRGIDPERPFDPMLRQQALAQLEADQRRQPNLSTTTWTPIGPAPIPNGQTVGTVTPVSGRTVAIAVHPTNPDIVYVGTANGGLYRSTNGGTTWVPLMDSALSLAIGAVAIAPSQPDTVYVGTGEPNFSLDSFFGVGLYRIDNASSATPTITGPLNKDASNADVFTGRAISEIQVHPSNPAILFLATTSGVGGLGSASPTTPSRGVYRTTNATSANPVFEKLTGLAANANSSVRDIVIDPLNPDLLVAGVVATGGVGGIYVSTNALSATPTFTQAVVFTATSTSELTSEFALHHTAGPTPTIYAAVGNLGGRVLKSTDGGLTWPEQVDNNFCTPQCFYDIAIDVAPNDANRVYLGGSPNLPFGISTTGGTAFTSSSNGLHVDSHVIAVSKSNPAVVYFGSDGGIYRSGDSGATWTPLNNTTFSATQFQSLATHPRDPELMIGGTQDNGTQLRLTDATWTRTDGGDGGSTQIDQNATDTTNVRMYHTYFNQTTAMGYARATTPGGAWTFFGCGFGGSTANGMTCAASAILFYAPTAIGPGNPNTYYFGSDVLYRSTDGGTTVSKVSQEPIASAVAISAIGIAPSDDNVRAVGLVNGALFRTINGATTLTAFDPVGAGSVIPDVYIGRIVFHPTDANIVYVTVSAYPGANLTVWKSTNFLSATPTFAAAATGLPNVPVNAFVIDPAAPTNVYAGTDIGIYRSLDSGATWNAFSNGLPRSPVFDMAFQAASKPGGRGPLRIATHGRGIWEMGFDGVFRNGYE